MPRAPAENLHLCLERERRDSPSAQMQGRASGQQLKSDLCLLRKGTSVSGATGRGSNFPSARQRTESLNRGPPYVE